MSSKPPLLFLAHRIPYPPNKGDKIRSFHFLKNLAQHFEIYLGAFIDEQEDWQHVPLLKLFCADVFFVGRQPIWHRIKSMLGLLSGDPLSVRYYDSARIQAWVSKKVATRKIEKAFIFCSPMAQFVTGEGKIASSLSRLVIDFVDVDSEKWAQYAATKRGVAHWVYEREARTLKSYESRVCDRAQASLLVSSDEAEKFKDRDLKAPSRVVTISNGVDADYFCPDESLPSPYEPARFVLVFIGAMDYLPNVDAVVWFCEQVLPRVKADHPRVEFWIVGSRPTRKVARLAESDGVYVTGYVEDVRPYLQHANIAIAPIQIARGVQNKVLEALAMGVPVVSSPEALIGIDEKCLLGTLKAEQVSEYIALISKFLSNDIDIDLDRGAIRESVLQNYSWRESASSLIPLLSPEHGGKLPNPSRSEALPEACESQL